MGSDKSIPTPGRAAHVDPDVQARLDRIKNAVPRAMPKFKEGVILFPEPSVEADSPPETSATQEPDAPQVRPPARVRPVEKLVIAYKTAGDSVLKFAITLQVEEVAITQVALGFLYDPQKFALELTVSEEYSIAYRGQTYSAFYAGGYLPFKTIHGLHLLTFIRDVSKEPRPTNDQDGPSYSRE